MRLKYHLHLVAFVIAIACVIPLLASDQSRQALNDIAMARIFGKVIHCDYAYDDGSCKNPNGPNDPCVSCFDNHDNPNNPLGALCQFDDNNSHKTWKGIDRWICHQVGGNSQRTCNENDGQPECYANYKCATGAEQLNTKCGVVLPNRCSATVPQTLASCRECTRGNIDGVWEKLVIQSCPTR